MTEESFKVWGRYYPPEENTGQDRDDRPFVPGDVLELKENPKGPYKFLHENPDKPDHLVCEYWKPAPLGSYRQERVEVCFPASKMRHRRVGTIAIGIMLPKI